MTLGRSMHLSSLSFRFWVDGVGESTGGRRLTSLSLHVRCDRTPVEGVGTGGAVLVDLLGVESKSGSGCLLPPPHSN